MCKTFMRVFTKYLSNTKQYPREFLQILDSAFKVLGSEVKRKRKHEMKFSHTFSLICNWVQLALNKFRHLS